MTWKPTGHVDEQVRGWMKAKGWEVTATDYHFEQEIYAWRHQQPGGKSPTLRIACNVLEHNPAFVIPAPPPGAHPRSCDTLHESA